MRKLAAFFAPLMLIGLVGCASLSGAVSVLTSIQTLSVAQPVTPQVRQQIHLGYEILLTAAVEYRKLPQCAASQSPTITLPCYRRATVVALQQVNGRASDALAALDAWAVQHPTLDGAAVIAAVKTAFAQWQDVFKANGVVVPG